MKGKQIVNFMAYISIALIAVVMVVGSILGWLVNGNILNLLQTIAMFIAEIITAVYGYCFARSQKKIGWLIAYIIFVVLILVFTGINFASIIKALKG